MSLEIFWLVRRQHLRGVYHSILNKHTAMQMFWMYCGTLKPKKWCTVFYVCGASAKNNSHLLILLYFNFFVWKKSFDQQFAFWAFLRHFVGVLLFSRRIMIFLIFDSSPKFFHIKRHKKKTPPTAHITDLPSGLLCSSLGGGLVPFAFNYGCIFFPSPPFSSSAHISHFLLIRSTASLSLGRIPPPRLSPFCCQGNLR